LPVNQDGVRRDGFQVLALRDGSFDALEELDSAVGLIDAEVRAQLSREAIYASYIDRQSAEVAALRRDDALEIPADFEYSALGALSFELREKLERTRPGTIGQAARISGMTPSALTLILGALRHRERRLAS